MRTMRWIGMAALAMSLFAARAQEGGSRMIEDAIDEERSSWLGRIAYSRELGSDLGYLTVGLGGEMVTYIDVPVSVWRELKESESVGSYYGRHIKHKYERETGQPLWKSYDSPPPVTVQAEVQCAFNEECEPLILKAIGMATNRIRVAVYAFTRGRIARALAEAHERGVDVSIKMDAGQAEYPLAKKTLEYLAGKDIPIRRIRMVGEYAAMHNKFLTIDGERVLTGSHNFTTTAQVANWENLVWIESPSIAERYAQEWEAIRSEQ